MVQHRPEVPSVTKEMLDQAVAGVEGHMTENVAKIEGEIGEVRRMAGRVVEPVLLGEFELTFGGVVLALGVDRRVVPVPGVRIGEMIQPVALSLLPDGWLVGQAACVKAGEITVSFYRPALTAATVRFKIAFVAWRKAA